ncbi:MAG TPA: Arc family DNA-binding protein [Zeimonas sp.]
MDEPTVNLSIKAVPLELAQRLRERAARNHRSLQRELMAIIEAAAGAADTPSSIASAGFFRRKPREAIRSIDEVVDSLRARFPDPPADAPLGVDIIRAARDGR